MDVYVKFRERALFPCAKCGQPDQPVRDIANHDRTWRHLIFFEYPCYIHAELPRTNCGRCNSITRVNVRGHWINRSITLPCTSMRSSSNWPRMPMNAVSRLLGEHDTRLWRILHQRG
ncbi:transposase family protein [uncultured Paenibacillus sp.]|uniref:transposase family protein n=1 Tax=uncultured Paenibacillus sp. TaxID=227322 RepID=UPI0025D3964B|nr:transposase family protein [uncultured Paenibacillus sp.]